MSFFTQQIEAICALFFPGRWAVACPCNCCSLLFSRRGSPYVTFYAQGVTLRLGTNLGITKFASQEAHQMQPPPK